MYLIINEDSSLGQVKELTEDLLQAQEDGVIAIVQETADGFVTIESLDAKNLEWTTYEIEKEDD